MDYKELISTDDGLYWKAKNLNIILGISTQKAGLYLVICTFLHLKENVEYPELLKAAAQIAGVKRATVYAVLHNAIGRVQKRGVPGVFAELVKFKDKSTPIDFVIDYIDFLQEFNFVEEEDENGIFHAYYQSVVAGHRVPTLN